MPLTNNFFAILEDDKIRKILLTQDLTPIIRDVFVKYSQYIINDDYDEIKFDGNYVISDEEILFVNYILPDDLINAPKNPIGLEELNLEKDLIKTLFWFENDVYYFQNFDKRKLLRNRNVIFYDKKTFNNLKQDAFILDNVVNAVHKEGKLYFRSYVNANKIFSLMAFYKEATDEELKLFSKNKNISIDESWLLDNSNTILRKQITLIQKSEILKKANVKKIKSSAEKFSLIIELDNGKIKFPNDKKVCREILSYLNEHYYFGVISGNKFRTNSKRGIT